MKPASEDPMMKNLDKSHGISSEFFRLIAYHQSPSTNIENLCSHINSVDKFYDGDYLISMRNTNTIYRVSHKTGNILWRLGGKFSDFQQDFLFSGQHDARVVSQNDTVLIISFLDNASVYHEENMQTANSSSFKVVALYEHEDERRAEVSRWEQSMTNTQRFPRFSHLYVSTLNSLTLHHSS